MQRSRMPMLEHTLNSKRFFIRTSRPSNKHSCIIRPEFHPSPFMPLVRSTLPLRSRLAPAPAATLAATPAIEVRRATPVDYPPPPAHPRCVRSDGEPRKNLKAPALPQLAARTPKGKVPHMGFRERSVCNRSSSYLSDTTSGFRDVEQPDLSDPAESPPARSIIHSPTPARVSSHQCGGRRTAGLGHEGGHWSSSSKSTCRGIVQLAQRIITACQSRRGNE